LDRRSFVVALLAAVPAAHAQVEERPLVIGTSTLGGGFALYGETLERVLNARVGRTLMRARPTRGTPENLALLKSGEIDAALIQGTAASELLEQGPSSDLRILFAMYPSPGMLAVPTASPIVQLEEVVGKRVVLGVRTSGLVTLGRQVFSGIGIDVDRDLQAIYVDEAAASPRIVLAGDAVGLWGAGEGWPGFVQLAQSPGGARFIGPSTDQIARIVAKYPLLKPMDVAIGAYPGIARPLATVGSMNWIMTRADLDAVRAAAFVKAMDDAGADLAAALPQAAFSTLANTRASAPSPALLHRALAAMK
jgi:TRAP transporter TAXI family solute receptor